MNLDLARGYATIRTADHRHSVKALLGPGGADWSDGRGGWSEVSRPRRPAIAEWTGPALRKGALELLLDAYGTQKSLTAVLAAIDALAPQSPTSEPPTVYVLNAPPIPGTVPLVVQSVTYTDRLRNRNGDTTRVTVAFELLELRTGAVLGQRPSPAKRSADRHSTPGRAKARTVVVHKGDTLGGIAAKYLGSASKWKQIADLNDIRDPNRVKVGTKLKLP